MNAALVTALSTAIVSIIGAVSAAIVAVRSHASTNKALVNALQQSTPVPVPPKEGTP